MLRGDEEFPFWTSRRSRVLKVFLCNQMINTPLDRTNYHGWIRVRDLLDEDGRGRRLYCSGSQGDR